ncbi:MGH1-like glycoside hydrolase domain-containing protein [Dysgonomonas sp. GY617]|uniref:MGH1-like glycoside hydrolase domain-containing protein n=1 Tax=Dysgonomonas sp. GY617 TaxID=2780420 RepID=UPI00188440C0|nr:trehalase family glycosidase [Dysgonomonas sp. GY617]MBF0574369.1 glycoside hydrolase [Dysgonomonas sp. GY617]
MNRAILYTFYFISVLLASWLYSCTPTQQQDMQHDLASDYPNLLNLTHNPAKRTQGKGFFTDKGSWMGFSVPTKDTEVNGFCGPYDLDHRNWISSSLCQVSALSPEEIQIPLKLDTAIYYPGKAVLKSVGEKLQLDQELIFVTANHALLRCKSTADIYFKIEGNLSDSLIWDAESHNLIAGLKTGEVLGISFPQDVILEINGGGYNATSKKMGKQLDIVISYFNTKDDYLKLKGEIPEILSSSDQKIKEHTDRWNNYIASNIREDMPEKYNRVLVKSIMTLISNWRSPKGALLHAGVAPSHAMDYFVGFWAWDSWKHAVALASLDIELAKDQIRTMFDYQDEAGMIADCIYTDEKENNYRDTKPPLAVWAVDAIFKADKDTAFLAEIYPKLLKYHQWWYIYRDHDKNGICEYGATDGTIEAAKWESGMDNAIRFDDTKMVKNKENAWSMDQESIDLNAYLQYEYTLLKEMSGILNIAFDEPDRKALIQDHFYDSKLGYFFDKSLKGSFIEVYGPEGWTPLWTGLATKEQADNATKIMFDTNKFSTYIPFPTAAADNPKFTPRGYWRGPIWLDQVYFAISGIRKYGYTKEADEYTRQVFDRLQGLEDDAPIHENYDVHSGERLKAAHFSWSAAHLMLLYKEYGTALK